MGCMNGKNSASNPQKSSKRVVPFDDKNQSPLKDPNSQSNLNNNVQPVTITTQQHDDGNNVKKHYLPQQKKRVKETVTIKQATDTEGNKMINNYVFLETLGKGSFGKVKLAINRVEDKQTQYAVKIFKKSFLKRKREYYRDSGGAMKYKDALDNVKKEIAIMKKLKHVNVIRLYEVIENPDNDKLYMNFASGGQLIEWDDDEEKFFFCNQSQHEPYSESYLRDLFRGCIKGLYYLHNNGIIHRDIKPQNILLDKDGKAKLADFGVSAVTNEDDKVQGNEGTYYFMPPEALSKETSKEGYNGKRADIWSLGVAFFCFTFLEIPFQGGNLVEIFEVIKEKDLKFPDHRECSDGLKNIFKQMIEKDPSKRATLQTLAEDKWLNEGCSTTLAEEMKQEGDQVAVVNDEDVENAFQLSTVVRIKTWVARWKEHHNGKTTTELKQQNSGLKTSIKPSNSNNSQE